VREALLTSVPGVGRATARTLLAEMPELGSLDRRQIASLAGLAPWTRQSGKWKGKSFIEIARHDLPLDLDQKRRADTLTLVRWIDPEIGNRIVEMLPRRPADNAPACLRHRDRRP